MYCIDVSLLAGSTQLVDGELRRVIGMKTPTRSKQPLTAHVEPLFTLSLLLCHGLSLLTCVCDAWARLCTCPGVAVPHGVEECSKPPDTA